MKLLNKNGVPVDPKDAPKESRAIQDADIRSRGEWAACDHPERLSAPAYHDCCAACLIAAEADGQWMVPIMRERLERLGSMDDEVPS